MGRVGLITKFPVVGGFGRVHKCLVNKLMHQERVLGSVGITKKLMGGPPWRAIASLENFF